MTLIQLIKLHNQMVKMADKVFEERENTSIFDYKYCLLSDDYRNLWAKVCYYTKKIADTATFEEIERLRLTEECYYVLVR